MTVKQKQHLLAYLGYYHGQADGIWGRESRSATEDFQSDYQLQPDGIFGEETKARILRVITDGEMPCRRTDFWKEIRYFTPEEFRCKCGGRYCSGYPAQMQEKTLRVADAVREHFGLPVQVVSGLRCGEWNRIQGGVENSQHLYGEAADIRISGVTARQLLAFLKTQPIRYAYAINETNVHFDIEKGVR